MLEILETGEYRRWFAGLRDTAGKRRIDVRLRRLELGHLGNFRRVGEGVLELRIDYGPGYRVYLVRRGLAVIVLLAGGDKSSQRRDIERAKELARMEVEAVDG
jgi:putative addiction module killer protein